MEVWAILAVGLALSMDGLMVGMAYGIKRIYIPLQSLLIITLASLTAVTVSMLCGKALTLLLPSGLALYLGALLLVILGTYNLLSACRERINKLERDEEEPLLTLNIKILGIIIQILKEPASADFDSSGEIGVKEAFFLGLALSLDAFGAGVGLAMTGLNILYTALSVGMVQLVLVGGGLRLGKSLNSERFRDLSTMIPGFILIGIGLLKIV